MEESTEQRPQPVHPGPGDDEPMKVSVVDFDMPFFSMVGFMVKWALASIPALLILYLAVVVLGAMLLGGLSGRH